MSRSLISFPHILMVTFEDRSNFQINYIMKEENECWPWIGKHKVNGYGRFYFNKRNWLAHRVAYFFHHKNDPGVLDVLHDCNNRICVNPVHLTLGTNSDNMLHKFECGCDIKGEKGPNAKITNEIALYIRQSSKTQIELAKELNLGYSTINDIIRRKTWKHI